MANDSRASEPGDGRPLMTANRLDAIDRGFGCQESKKWDERHAIARGNEENHNSCTVNEDEPR